MPLTISAQYGLIDQNEFFDKRIASKDVSGYYLVKNGEFAYNKSTSNDAPWGAVKRLDRYKNGVVSTLYIVFSIRDSNTTDSDFLATYYDTDRWHSGIQAVAAEGARNHGLLNISASDFFNTTLKMPADIEEQRKIGAFFKEIDNTITLHQRKLEGMKLLKKSLLQKMFPKSGESVPEVRFPGFTDAWEQRKFAELANIRRGLTYKPNDVTDSGIRVLRSSNINEDSFIENDDDVFVKESAVNISSVKDGDILITSANGSNRLVGKHAIIFKAGQAVHGGFMLIASAYGNPYFLNASMSSSWYTNFVNMYVAGGNGAIGNLKKSDLENQVIRVPSEAEQLRIGQFFQSLDQTITLHQRKVEILHKLKKSLLRQMFV